MIIPGRSLRRCSLRRHRCLRFRQCQTDRRRRSRGHADRTSRAARSGARSSRHSRPTRLRLLQTGNGLRVPDRRRQAVDSMLPLLTRQVLPVVPSQVVAAEVRQERQPGQLRRRALPLSVLQVGSEVLRQAGAQRFCQHPKRREVFEISRLGKSVLIFNHPPFLFGFEITFVLLRVVILNYYVYFVVNLCRTEIIYVKLIFFYFRYTYFSRFVNKC